LSWPLFKLLAQPAAFPVLLGQCGFALLVAAYCATIPALLVEMFAAATRCTALSVSYNSAFALLGGTAPVVAVYLVGRESADLGPALYMGGVAAVSFIAALTLRDRTGQPLR
jgi:MHS family proline/betaine transporter-like MFS transporter